jgi:predicted neuraminidase
MVIESRDGGLSWSPPHRLPEGLLGPIKNKPIELDNGAWLSPSSTESEEENSKWQVHFEWSTDKGASWHRTPALNDGVEIQAIQPSLLKLTDGKWLGLGRTRQNKIFETESQDQGRTWTPLRLGTLPNNNSGLDAITLSNGQHLIVYNHVPGTPGEWGGKRTPLNVAISDDAQQWRGLLVLENTPGEYSYPAIIESADGTVHVTYTWNRKKIKHAMIRPATQP